MNGFSLKIFFSLNDVVFIYFKLRTFFFTLYIELEFVTHPYNFIFVFR